MIPYNPMCNLVRSCPPSFSIPGVALSPWRNVVAIESKAVNPRLVQLVVDNIGGRAFSAGT